METEIEELEEEELEEEEEEEKMRRKKGLRADKMQRCAYTRASARPSMQKAMSANRSGPPPKSAR